MLLFLINSLYNGYLYLLFLKFTKPIELTIEQFKLFGIDEKEIGFKLKSNKDSLIDQKIEVLEKNTPKDNSMTPKFDLSANLKPMGHSVDHLSRLHNETNPSPNKSSSSWLRDSFTKQSDTSLTNKSFNQELRFRKSRSFLHNNDSSAFDSIASRSAVEQFLREQEQRNEELQDLIKAEKRYVSLNEINSSPLPMSQSQNYSPLNSSRSDLSFGYGMSSLINNSNNQSPRIINQSNHLYSNDFSSKFVNANLSADHLSSSPIVSTPFRQSYKAAIKISPPSSPEKSEILNSSHHLIEKILIKLDVDDSKLNQMVENIRMWLSQTILIRLVNEINNINKSIIEKGYIDSVIGETSIKQLKYLAANKRSEFPTLEQVCPFLDIKNIRNIENNVPFQQYLVRRIKDLAKGGCMIEFLWDGGGTYNYQQWKEDNITDSEILMHLFCVYMDSRLLYNPTIPEGRPFTRQYFRSAEKFSDETFRSDTYIKQDKSFPPHYSLMLKGEPFEIPPGRNNLFHSLLVFIHQIKIKNFGLLGRINLGPSGLNITWVIEKQNTHHF
ncbi:Cytochrome B561-like protein [Sarcoptes scabiei]|nr:Cytochrome B561-like protein [Sarcoptes scabiei]